MNNKLVIKGMLVLFGNIENVFVVSINETLEFVIHTVVSHYALKDGNDYV